MSAERRGGTPSAWGADESHEWTREALRDAAAKIRRALDLASPPVVVEVPADALDAVVERFRRLVERGELVHRDPADFRPRPRTEIPPHRMSDAEFATRYALTAWRWSR